MVEQDSARPLVERAKGGDREAFDQLEKVYRDRLASSLRNLCRFHIGPKVDVNDILQDTFLRAYQSLGRFEWIDGDSFFRWLCGIAKRSLAQAAQDARRAERGAVEESVPESGTSPSKHLRRQERFDRLESALGKLSPDDRQVILLSRIKGLPSAEVAERMNSTPAAVRQRLVRALRELKKIFGDTESFHLPDQELRIEGEDGAK